MQWPSWRGYTVGRLKNSSVSRVARRKPHQAAGLHNHAVHVSPPPTSREKLTDRLVLAFDVPYPLDH